MNAAITDSPDDSRRVLRVLRVLRRLHERKLSVDWSFLPWEEAGKIEVMLRSSGGIRSEAIHGGDRVQTGLISLLFLVLLVLIECEPEEE